MTEDPTRSSGERSALSPDLGQPRSTQRIRTTRHFGNRPAIGLAGVAIVMAGAALVVALTRTTVARLAPDPPVPTNSAADISTAQQQLCDIYKVQARTVRADTSGNDEALARIAATNGAVMLYNAATNPALDAKHRDGARALAMAYGNVSALGSKGVATDVEWRAVLDDANAKDAAMKQLCGGE